MNKRYDNRTEEEFKVEIAERTLLERNLFLRWIKMRERETGEKSEFADTGCGNHGEFIEDKEVSTDADFNVKGIGPVEVKFAKPMLKRDFHLKVGQTKSYIKQNAVILMVIGADGTIPKFTVISVESLEEIVETCPIVKWVGFGFKAAYRIPIDKFVWRDLE
jgi:hypothetical protein